MAVVHCWLHPQTSCGCDHHDEDALGESLFPCIDTTKVFALNATRGEGAGRVCKSLCQRRDKIQVRWWVVSSCLCMFGLVEVCVPVQLFVFAV